MAKKSYLFTSESVSEGHPDKICDRISDAIVDAYLAAQPDSRVAVETLATTNRIVLAGEVRGPAEIDAVGGLTLGADPVATALLHAAASRGLELDAFVVRKEAKSHGLQRRIEGPDVAGRKVVAVEDTSTTGGSVLTAVEALREAGADVRAVAVIVDRDTGAREAIEAEGLPYLYLYSLGDLGLE